MLNKLCSNLIESGRFISCTYSFYQDLLNNNNSYSKREIYIEKEQPDSNLESEPELEKKVTLKIIITNLQLYLE